MSTAVLSALLLGFTGPAEPPVELPPPAVLAPPVVLHAHAGVMPPPLGYPALPLPPWAYRPSAYEHWKHRAVSDHGFLRPRVVYTPRGSYYSYNGEPYPRTFTHQAAFRP